MMSRRWSVVVALAAVGWLAPSAGRSLRFAVASDSQLTFDNPLAEPRIFLTFLKDMNAQDPRPAFVLHCGDIITGWTSDPGVLKRQYRTFRAAVATVPFPIHIAMGNHEGYTRESVEMFQREIGPTYHSFDRDGWHFVLLDTGNEAHYGTLGGEQEAWLGKDLEKSRGMKGTFVALHVPIAADEMEGWLEMDKGERDRLHALFRANNVKAVFQGHVHTYELCIRDGIRYVLTGSSGGPLEHWPPTGHFYDYLLVDAEEGSLSIVSRRLNEIEAEEQDRATPKPAPAAAAPGAVLDGFEDGTGMRWSVYNDLVKTAPDDKAFTEGRRSLRMDFDFAVSLWPMLMSSSATPWDMSGSRGVAVDVWTAPAVFEAKDEVPGVQLSAGKSKSAARELAKGAWTTLRWDFAEAAWASGKKEGGKRALGKSDLGSVDGLTLSIISDPQVPRRDWERRMKGYILLDNLRTY